MGIDFSHLDVKRENRCECFTAIDFENDVLFQKVTQAYSEKKIRVFLSGVEPKTFRLLVQMLYH